DVAGEAVGSVGAKILEPRLGLGRSAVEIAHGGDDLAEQKVAGCLFPVKYGGQPLVHKCSVGGRLVPAHAADGEIRLSFGKHTEFPGGGTRSPRLVGKATDCLLKPSPGFIAREGLRPVLRIAIATRVDEALELPIRDLEFVDPEVRQDD